MKNEKVCCFTGHRPDYFPWKGDVLDTRQAELLTRIDGAIDTALEKGARRFICGNALGVDTWAAQLVLEKKKENPEIVLEIAKPFYKHNDIYKECAEVCAKADYVNVVSDNKNHRTAFFDRNRYMVDNSDILIAVCDGAQKGGTKWTFEYAKERGIDVIQVLWQDIK